MTAAREQKSLTGVALSGERGPGGAVGYAVAIALAAGPSCQLGAVVRVGELGALGVGGQVQHPHGLVMIKDVQDRVFEAGCPGQLGEHPPAARAAC